MGDVLIYLPPECRQHNVGPSCVFASITTCLRCAGCWKEADIFFSRYRGPGNPNNTRYRLDQCGAKYKMLFNASSDEIISVLMTGRPIAIAWGGNHFVTLVGKINGNAYIVNNQCPTRYTIVEWNRFMNMHRHQGNWGVYILNGKVPKSVDKGSLKDWEDSLKKSGNISYEL